MFTLQIGSIAQIFFYHTTIILASLRYSLVSITWTSGTLLFHNTLIVIPTVGIQPQISYSDGSKSW